MGWFDAYVRPFYVDSIRLAEALMEMMLNRDGQGPYRDYRADSHPLQQQQLSSAAAAADESQRRPVPSSPPLPVVVEDAEAQHRTEQHLFDAFGSSPMPALDQVNFRVRPITTTTHHHPPPPMPCAHAAHNRDGRPRRLWTRSVAASSSDRDSSARFGSRDPTCWR